MVAITSLAFLIIIFFLIRIGRRSRFFEGGGGQGCDHLPTLHVLQHCPFFVGPFIVASTPSPVKHVKINGHLGSQKRRLHGELVQERGI